MASKVKEGYSIQEAMDNLAAIARIDLEAPTLIGLIRGRRIVTDAEEYRPASVVWLSEEIDPILQVMDATYRTVHHHLASLLENSEVNWDDPHTLKGITAMMAIAGESAVKMERYLEYRLGRKGISIRNRPEYEELTQFYQNEFAKKIKGERVVEKLPDEWIDLESAKRDRDYELFYIRKEDGKPYFDARLIRDLKLACDFDSTESFEEDPLLKIRSMQDRDLQASARQVLDDCHDLLDDFYRLSKKVKDDLLVSHLNMALTALFLAATPRNLIQNTVGKSCMQYFDDFHRFLRDSMQTPEYQKLIAYPPEKSDKSANLLLQLIHALAFSFFVRSGGVKQEAIGLIHRTMRRGEEVKRGKKRGDTFWNQFMLDDEKLRTLLAQFPSGPLFKTLDMIREEQDEDQTIPFDPIGQHNLPMKLYEIEERGHTIRVLRIPSPTTQTIINKVQIIDEFRGFLRAISSTKPEQRHLIINLQDRTSWKEFARCKALEELQKNAEFGGNLYVITLPKMTDFYYQNNEYLDLNEAKKFLAVISEQLATPEACGFFFPPSMSGAELTRFVQKCVPLIHKYFFEGKNTLSRRNREDFIEIFYQFLILKAIDHLEPATMSFTCKDALDTGAAAHSAFYAFAQLFNGSLDGREEGDFLRWLAYGPALFVRERAIDAERMNRMLTALETFDAQMGTRTEEIVKAFSDLYSSEALKKLTVKRGA